MANVFNADDPIGAPYFTSLVKPFTKLEFHEFFSDAHVPGRPLDALLRVESLGFTTDENAVAHHGRVAYFSYSGTTASSQSKCYMTAIVH